MKLLLLLFITLGTFAHANPIFRTEEFEHLSGEQRVMLIDAYREFLSSYSEEAELARFSAFRFNIFAEAWAAGNFDCFYAGWPSRSTPKPGGGKLCMSPLRGNPDYRTTASACGADSLLCQPMLFGSGICVSVATKALKNSAYKNCEDRFRASGKSTADVVREIDTPEKRAQLTEMVSATERICRGGFQAGICRKLSARLGEINASAARNLESAARTVAQVTTDQIEPNPVDCDPDTPGIQLTPPTRTVSVQTDRAVAEVRRPRSERRVICQVPSPTREVPPLENLLPILRENNIHIVAGSPTARDVQNFLDDFNRFPATLREEMKQRGARINLIVGNGVTQDPSWAAEQARAGSNAAGWETTHDGRDFDNIPGTGGSVRFNIPTRIVINQMHGLRGAGALFLHEYAHTMDNLHANHAISNSTAWREALALDRAGAASFLTNLCPGNYCNNPQHPEETFAELFAYHHACGESNADLRERMPNVARFFDNFTSVRTYFGASGR